MVLAVTNEVDGLDGFQAFGLPDDDLVKVLLSAKPGGPGIHQSRLELAARGDLLWGEGEFLRGVVAGRFYAEVEPGLTGHLVYLLVQRFKIAIGDQLQRANRLKHLASCVSLAQQLVVVVVAVQDLALLFFQLRKVEPRPVHPVAELQTELRRGVLPGVHQHGLFAGRGCQQQVTFMASHVEITLAPLITLLAFLKLPALVQIIPIDLAPVPLWD
ncbi:hypothetical protein D9M71_393980 [compost metagenome]